ncbi:MAG: transketolase [Deltaproteobacteria bacterium]|nr:transketolase [Deltaproteobacteria bacterium]
MIQTKDLDQLCINTIRTLAIDAVQAANSGHPGLPMGAAAMAYVLWTRFLKHNPANPQWPDRDRFILSAGHGSMLLYSLLHLTGYDLPLVEIKNFRQWGSKTPGHPESSTTPGVETTTGPLGQGFGNGVGLAVAERFLAAHFNRPGHEIVDHYTYALCSDGELMEGVTHEAASLAGHWKLGKLIYFYDDNRISIEGSTELAFTENRMVRFEAYGWHVQKIDDGNDIQAIEKAIRAAQEEKGRPSLISVRTHIGFGSPNKQDQASVHGEPLGADELRLTKENLGWPLEPSFFIPEESLKHFRQALAKGRQWEKDWTGRFTAYEMAYPELAREWRQWLNKELPVGWDQDIPSFPADSKGLATRAASGTVLNALAPRLPNLIGGSADLAPSTKTLMKGERDFQAGNYGGRNFHFGVREHGMGTILNGLALHGGVIPYGGTFLIFSDYMRPPIRLAALMGLKVIYIFTHDSIGLGEDGPTHQPVEQLAALRAIPNLVVIRPGDANETAVAWRFALAYKGGPLALCLSRQNLPTLDREKFALTEGLCRGGYTLNDAMGQAVPDLILIASGSEVSIALEAGEKLRENGFSIRVVSMPSQELFEKQPEDHREQVLPKTARVRMTIEAGVSQGWHRYLNYRGEAIGIDHFGASAPYQILYEQFGITVRRVVEKALQLLKRC